MLAPVYARTDRADGLDSLEVAPALADDADATVDAARDLWGSRRPPERRDQDPGHPGGVEATRRAIAERINVNVTLFSVERHAAIVDAYIAGLDERLRRGERILLLRDAAGPVRRVDASAPGRPLVAQMGA